MSTQAEIPQWRCWIAEVFGTFTLVFTGAGAIVINAASVSPTTPAGAITHVGIALIFGLIVMVMIYTIGEVSGAHINPAVTLGFWVARRLEGRRVLPYIIAQCAGALLASGLLWFLYPESTTYGQTVPAGSAAQSFILEVVITLLLMYVVLSVSAGAKEKGITAGIVVGGYIAVAAMFSGPTCGASLNPARSLGPAVFAGDLNHLWIYLTAPVGGALLAVPIYAAIHGGDENENQA